MSDPHRQTSATPPRHGNGTRYLFMLLLGLVLGIMATVMTLRALEARRDHFPDSLMHVQQWHLGQLRTSVEQNRCNTSDALPHLQALRVLANDVEPAFPGLSDDPRFAGHARQLRVDLDAALADPPRDCAQLTSAVQTVGKSCKGCHQDFRG
ncbi:MAG: cytochrome c [Pseudomonadota bacterium]|nr:cytochrome c [Pseudomonadota bacterium]